MEIDSQYEAAWREWALCELRQGNLTRALRMAKRAVSYAPSSLSATTTVAQVHEARKEPDLAIRQLVAFVALFPENRAAWRELYLTARRQNDEAWTLAAAEVLDDELQADTALTSGEPAAVLVAQALTSGGLDEARPTAVQHGMPPLELAWLALDLGFAKEAARQAELVLAANPTNFEAALAALAAHHEAGSRSGFRRRLQAMPSPRGAELSERGVVAMRELLAELAGSEAALVFLEEAAVAHGETAHEEQARDRGANEPDGDGMGHRGAGAN
jgi:tetratricopeptide (TPR) repeat protein